MRPGRFHARRERGEEETGRVFHELAEMPGVEIRTKRTPAAPMHLKSYQIDGRLLRTGAANFSASGLKRQDNDLIVIESAEAAAAFKRAFDARFANGEFSRLRIHWSLETSLRLAVAYRGLACIYCRRHRLFCRIHSGEGNGARGCSIS